MDIDVHALPHMAHLGDLERILFLRKIKTIKKNDIFKLIHLEYPSMAAAAT